MSFETSTLNFVASSLNLYMEYKFKEEGEITEMLVNYFCLPVSFNSKFCLALSCLTQKSANSYKLFRT